MRSFARTVYPDEYSDELFETRKEYVRSSREIFTGLYEVHDHHERYDLHWAFRDAARIFKEFSDHLPARPKTASPRAPEYDEHFDEMRNRVRKYIAVTGRKYELLSFVVSFIDIAISVALILVVTALAHLGEKGLESIILLVGFVSVVALVKVSLDRFFIIPRVEKLGWNMYRRLTLRVMDNAAKITAIRVIINGTRERIGENRCLVDLCHRGFKEIKRDAADPPEDFRNRRTSPGGA
jgi:hypothetical protein